MTNNQEQSLEVVRSIEAELNRAIERCRKDNEPLAAAARNVLAAELECELKGHDTEMGGPYGHLLPTDAAVQGARRCLAIIAPPRPPQELQELCQVLDGALNELRHHLFDSGLVLDVLQEDPVKRAAETLNRGRAACRECWELRRLQEQGWQKQPTDWSGLRRQPELRGHCFA